MQSAIGHTGGLASYKTAVKEILVLDSWSCYLVIFYRLLGLLLKFTGLIVFYCAPFTFSGSFSQI